MSEDEVLARQNVEKAVLASLEQGLGGSCVSVVSYVGGGNAALGGGDNNDDGPSLGGSCVSVISYVGGSAP